MNVGDKVLYEGREYTIISLIGNGGPAPVIAIVQDAGMNTIYVQIPYLTRIEGGGNG